MKHLSLSLTLAAAIGLCSCSNQDVINECPDIMDNPAAQAIISVPDNNPVLTEPKAMQAALRVLSREGGMSRSAEGMSVTAINDDSGKALIYAINFGTDNGFVLLAADKRAYPVVAMSQTGHFDCTNLENTPYGAWIEGAKIAISHPECMPDSIAALARQEWLSLTSSEEKYTAGSRSTGDEYIDNVIASAISTWRGQGYTVTCAAYANPNDYPDRIASLIRQVQSQTVVYPNPAQTSFILTKQVTSTTNPRPTVNTVWHQQYPYNASLPEGAEYIGCVPIAVAQIMNYHKKPTTIDFSQFPNMLLPYSGKTPLTDFLREVGEACGINYYNDKPGANIDDAINALNSYGYTSEKINFEISKILEGLKTGPVYLRGPIEGSKDGHAWVCDGGLAGGYATAYTFVTYTGDFADINPTAAFATRGTDNVASTLVPSLHMIWGWNQQGDGWYYSSDWNVTLNKADGTTETRHIYKNQEALINILYFN
ncbi:MAG: C10 family peptidase [Muribaculaceae bacterium]|nr:C10 family peptidase [Muribaculaceae bacterium]